MRAHKKHAMGGDLGGTGGWSPSNFEVGDGPCIRPPNISRSGVTGCVAKYEHTKKGVMEELLCEIEILRQKRVI